ncbi:hypothetical protein K438DRAFT_1961002 [Mycena galopus ATCC 62051]|nr:hypothetical protein K438DRAFT_1961002 [Mycena galopus ATCC 62051]
MATAGGKKASPLGLDDKLASRQTQVKVAGGDGYGALSRSASATSPIPSTRSFNSVMAARREEKLAAELRARDERLAADRQAHEARLAARRAKTPGSASADGLSTRSPGQGKPSGSVSSTPAKSSSEMGGDEPAHEGLSSQHQIFVWRRDSHGTAGRWLSDDGGVLRAISDAFSFIADRPLFISLWWAITVFKGLLGSVSLDVCRSVQVSVAGYKGPV